MAAWTPSDWAAVVQATVAVIAGIALVPQIRAAARQVILAAKTQQATDFMTVVSLDIAIGEARAGMLAAGAEMREALDDGKLDLAALRQTIYEASKEQYLNLLDRLCSGMVHGIIPEETFRADYYSTVKNTAEDVGGMSRHRHILEVNAAWVEGKPAKR